MVQEAEANKDADMQFEQLVTARNQADHTIHSTRKQLAEAGDALPAADKEQVESAITALENVKSGDDKDVIEQHTQALMAAAQKLMEHAQTQANTQQQADAQSNAKDDDVVDAEFEEVK